MITKIFYSTTNKNSTEVLLKTLKNRDKTKKHLIIAPDRCALNIEKKLFALNCEECFFGVNVLSFTQLCKSTLSKLKLNKKILSKQSGIALIKKILIENIESLKSFIKVSEFDGFATEIFETICLFKSCGISPNNIDINTISNSLNLKLNDIKMVYQKYEDFFEDEYSDSFNQLDLFSSVIDKNTFKDTCFYFVEFADFTKQMYNIISKIMRFNDVNIATTSSRGNDIKNKNIHTDLIFYNIIDLCKLNGVEYKLIECENIYDEAYFHMSKNLLSTSPEKYSKSFEELSIYSFKNYEQELTFVLSKIKNKIINEGCLYKDFCIVVPSLEQYKNITEKVFKTFEIPYYLDLSETLNENILSRFILNLLKLTENNFSLQELMNFLKSPILLQDFTKVCKYENSLKEKGFFKFLHFEKILEFCEDENILQVLNSILNFVNKIKDRENVSEYIDAIISLLGELKFNENVTTILNKYLDEDDILSYRKFNTAYTKIINIFKEVSEVFKSSGLSFEITIEMIESYLKNTILTMPPLSVDSVLVGDSVNSYYDNFENVYILNVNIDLYPAIIAETGIILDSEIECLSNRNKLTPTIQLINKRNKFKCFENFFVSSKNLTVCYLLNSLNNETLYPSIFIQNLQTIFNKKVIDGSMAFDMINNSYYELDEENILFNNFNLKSAKSNFIKLLNLYNTFKDNYNFNQIQSSLCEALGEYSSKLLNNCTYKNITENITTDKLFLQNRSTSVSAIENYCKCPFQYFVENGLRLQKEQDGLIKPIDTGNIIHEYLKEYVPIVIKDVENFIIDNEFCMMLLEKILNKESYKNIVTNENNKFAIKALKQEVLNISEVVVYQLKNSSYVPKYFELPFGNSKTLSVKTKNFDVQFRGVIDRVDIFEEEIEGIREDKFRIIDYKTGSSSFSDFTDLYTGKKLQLLLYAKQIKDNTNYKFGGAFYMPLSDDFSDNTFDKSKLKGVIEKSLSNILANDKNLSNIKYSSNILDLKTKLDGTFASNNFLNRNLLDEEEMNFLTDFAFKKVKEAVNNIANGKIELRPLKTKGFVACDFCDCQTICKFNKLYGNKFNEQDNILTVSELKESCIEDK